jgi:hypothetical protein
MVRHEPDEIAAIWGELLDGFLDRCAVHRFRHFVESFAGSRWKPSIALVLPVEFALRRRAHRRDLAVALEVLASVMDRYNVAVVSDSRDAARLFLGVRPFSSEAVAACEGAIVLLSRSLNESVGAIRPSRYITADPCAYRMNKQRIVFTDTGSVLPFAPADDGEVERVVRGRLPVFLDEDDEVPAYLAALRRLRDRGLALRITLSSRADEDFAQRAHAAFTDDPRVEVRDAEPRGLDDGFEFQVSNEPISLLAQHHAPLVRFLFRQGRWWRVGAEAPSRVDYYLFRGEESNSHGLLNRWLGRGDRDQARPPAPRLDGVIEPLISIVVPIHDRTSEIVRLAHSIYEQDYPWIEVIFVCNGSPPETLEAVRASEGYLMKRRFRVRILELAGACGAATIPRDLGGWAGTGDLICVLDSDDWLDPNFFAFARDGQWRDDTLYYPKRVFRDHHRPMPPNYVFDQPLPNVGTVEPDEFAATLRRLGNFLNNSGVCFPRALFVRGGGIDHRLRYGEDLYLWYRLARAGARAEEHDGRVNIALHPGNNELVVGDDGRLEDACALARRQELIPWL